MSKFISVFLIIVGVCVIVWFFLSPMGKHDIIQGILGTIMLAQGSYCLVQSPDHWCNLAWDDNVKFRKSD